MSLREHIKRSIYTKADPSRDGKLFYLFCEGEVREVAYFHYFNKITSQIVLQIVEIEDRKNSPQGLYEYAYNQLIIPQSTFDFREGDEVWFVIDTDEWGIKINELRKSISTHKDWFIAQSNPCFEVWLYYHIKNEPPPFPVENWKSFLNSCLPGGFDYRKHPRFIQSAIVNAKNNYTATDNQPNLGTSQVFMLAERFYPLVKEEVERM